MRGLIFGCLLLMCVEAAAEQHSTRHYMSPDYSALVEKQKKKPAPPVLVVETTPISLNEAPSVILMVVGVFAFLVSRFYK